MKLKQLAAAMIMATGSVSTLAATYDVTPLPVTDIAKSNFGKSIDLGCSASFSKLGFKADNLEDED